MIGVPKGMDGWTVLKGDECIKLKHNSTKRVFTLRQSYDDYWEVYAASPSIDGPRKEGALIGKFHGQRNALLAIGFLRQR